MNHLRYLFFATLLPLLTWGLAGCSDDGPDDNGTQPETGLTIKANADSVPLGESVTFTVFMDGTDVTSKARIYNVATSETLKGAFSADKASTYRFAAEYNGQKSKAIEIKVFASFGDDGEFYKHVLVHQYTGLWCAACPQMTVYLDKIGTSTPDRMILLAININDKYAIQDGEDLKKDFKVESLPSAIFDYMKEPVGALPADLEAALYNAVKFYPAVCGIALKSSVADNKATVQARLRFAAGGTYRVACALVEDKIPGAGTKDGYYNYKLRKFATNRLGDDLGVKKAGDEQTSVFSIDLDKAWKVKNCRVIVSVIDAEGHANNTATCAIDNGSCDFEYEKK